MILNYFYIYSLNDTLINRTHPQMSFLIDYKYRDAHALQMCCHLSTSIVYTRLAMHRLTLGNPMKLYCEYRMHGLGREPATKHAVISLQKSSKNACNFEIQVNR